jgi:hypothetical protein
VGDRGHSQMQSVRCCARPGRWQRLG